MKRRLLIIAIFLLLGAVVNVAVAWGCALWVTYSKSPERQFVGGDPVSPFTDRVFDVFQSFGSEFVQDPYGDSAFYTHRDDHVFLARPRFADWSRGRTLGPLEDPWSPRIEAEEARGWPALSLSWHYWVERTFDEYGGVASGTRSLRYGWSLGGTRVVQYGWRHGPVSFRLDARIMGLDARIIPYRPIWPGFAINTLFYAALLWLLIPGPFALRRFLRVRRGLCPKCAYPMMGESSVCTECGKPLPSPT